MVLQKRGVGLKWLGFMNFMMQHPEYSVSLSRANIENGFMWLVWEPHVDICPCEFILIRLSAEDRLFAQLSDVTSSMTLNGHRVATNGLKAI